MGGLHGFYRTSIGKRPNQGRRDSQRSSRFVHRVGWQSAAITDSSSLETAALTLSLRVVAAAAVRIETKKCHAVN